MTDVIHRILADLPSPASRFEPIRSKAGVHVFRCGYEGKPAVVKFFEHAGDRREIDHYRILKTIGVPTLNAYALGKSCIVMEDISASSDWRLGDEADMTRPAVLRSLAKWYFALHEAGENLPQLTEMYSENDELTPSAIAFLREKLPGAEPLCAFILSRLDDLRGLLRAGENTLAYNDFYFTNLLVRKDETAAMMFDYNLMGRGCRYADFRNVESSVSSEAFAAFTEEYAALYRAKHGRGFSFGETDRRLDEFVSPLLGLVSALKREKFPAWASGMREDALNGELLAKGKEIMKHAQR